MNNLQKQEIESYVTYEDAYAIFRHDGTNDVLWKLKAGKWSILGYDKKSKWQRVRCFKTKVQRHRLVWLLHKRSWPKDGVDHIDGNPRNNRIENLRECTTEENGQNRGIGSNNKSGFVGICFKRGKYEVSMKVKKQYRYIGRFELLDDAVHALRMAKEGLHTFNPDVVLRKSIGD